MSNVISTTEHVLEGLQSVVLNSVISFHLGKSMNKYCMMVVNYLIILLWLFLAAGLLRRFCYREGVMVIRCAVSSLVIGKNVYSCSE